MPLSDHPPTAFSIQLRSPWKMTGCHTPKSLKEWLMSKSDRPKEYAGWNRYALREYGPEFVSSLWPHVNCASAEKVWENWCLSPASIMLFFDQPPLPKVLTPL